MDKPERIFLRVSEVGDLLGCSRSKAYEMVAQGLLPSIRISGLLRVPRIAIEKLAADAIESSR